MNEVFAKYENLKNLVVIRIEIRFWFPYFFFNPWISAIDFRGFPIKQPQTQIPNPNSQQTP